MIGADMATHGTYDDGGTDLLNCLAAICCVHGSRSTRRRLGDPPWQSGLEISELLHAWVACTCLRVGRPAGLVSREIGIGLPLQGKI